MRKPNHFLRDSTEPLHSANGATESFDVRDAHPATSSEHPRHCSRVNARRRAQLAEIDARKVTQELLSESSANSSGGASKLRHLVPSSGRSTHRTGLSASV
jgi:hypothetical protein